MKTLRDYRVAGALYIGDTGVEAAVSDQVTLFLDTDANPGFPESIVGTVQHPIVKVNCDSETSYIIEYDEADLDGAATLIRAGDVVDATVVSGVKVVADELDDEIARALAAEALLAPKASPTFTGTVTLPATTSIGNVSNVELGYLDGVTSAIQTQLAAGLMRANHTGNETISGGVTLTVNSGGTFQCNAGSIVNFDTVPTTPTSAYGTNSTALATTAFVQGIINKGFASTPQALSGAGAVNVTSLSTELTSTGVAQAVTLADGTHGQIKTIVHGVDGGSIVLTPTTKTGYTTITFTNAGESAVLQFFTTRGWIILALRGAVAA